MLSFLENLYSEQDRALHIEEQEMIQHIQTSTIPAQVYVLAKQYNYWGNLSPSFQLYLKNRYQQILFQNMIIHNQTKWFLELFEEKQITVIPLKGTYLAQKYFYDLGGRCTTDIDLLVQKKDYKRAVQLLKNNNCMLTKQEPHHFHENFSYHQGGHTFSIELHWNILHENIVHINMNAFWNEAMKLENYHYVKQLSHYHTFYAICIHGWGHQMASLKYFMDIVQLLHYETIDFHRLLEDAKKDGVQKRVRNTLGIVYHYFPHLNKQVPFPIQLSCPLWWKEEILHSNGRRGFDSKILTYLHWFLGEFYHHCLDGDTLVDQYKMFKGWAIPSKEEIIYQGFKNYRGYYQAIWKRASKAVVRT